MGPVTWPYHRDALCASWRMSDELPIVSTPGPTPRWEVAEWNFKSRCWQMVDTCYKTDTAVAVLKGFRAIRPCRAQRMRELY